MDSNETVIVDQGVLPDNSGAPAEAAAEEVKPRGPSRIRPIVRWITYVTLALVPVWFLPWTSDVLDLNKQLLLLIATSVGLILYFFDVIRRGELVYRFSKLQWIIIGFCVAVLVATIFSVNPYLSIFGNGSSHANSLLFWISLVLLTFLLISTAENKGRPFLDLLTGGLALALFLGFMNAVGMSIFGGKFGVRGFNTIGTLNALALLAAVSMPLFLHVLHWTGQARNTIMNIVRIVGLLFSILILAIVNQWFIWVVVFISMGILIALRAARGGGLKMKLFALPMGVIVLGAFLMIVQFDWTSVRTQLPVEIWLTSGTSYDIALHSMQSRPFGFGPENYGIAFDLYRPAELQNTVFYRNRFFDGRSELFSGMTEIGMLFLLALAFSIGIILWQTVRIARGKVNIDETGMAIWATIVAIMAAIFVYPFNISLYVLFASAIILYVLALSENETAKVVNLEQSGGISFVGSIGFVLGLIAVLFGGYYMIKNYQSNVQLADAASVSDYDTQILHYANAINDNPRDSRLYQLMSTTLMDRVGKELKAGPKKDESNADYAARVNNYIDTAVSLAQRSTQVDPADSENWLNLGYMYQNVIGFRQNADQLALDNYTESLKRNPSDVIAYTRIGTTYLTLAENAITKKATNDTVQALLSKAEDNLKKATALSANFGLANYNLAVVYDHEGRLPDAIKQFQRLAASDPTNAAWYFQLGLLQYRNNQKDDAIKSWEQAVAIFPRYANARWYLSLAYEEKNEMDKALAEVVEIQKDNPDNVLVKQRLDQLTAGTKTIPPGKVVDQKPLN